MKYSLLWFLKEYIYEQEAKHMFREKTTAEVVQMKRRNVLRGMRLWLSEKQKKRALKMELDHNYERKLKVNVLKGLISNLEHNYAVNCFGYNQQLAFKKTHFHLLKEACQKQARLRDALI